VEGYTTLSEALEPEELRELTGAYFEEVFAPIHAHGGFVAEIQGDGILAIWEIDSPDSAAKDGACKAALDILEGVNRFNSPSGDLQLPTRLGLHSGYIFLGYVGASGHYEYRPVGDIVNTASRIESLNKYLGTKILVSEEALSQVEGFLTREVGAFVLFGKSRPTVIHELVSGKDEADERLIHGCRQFAKGLRAYKTRSWDEAISIFMGSGEILGDDGPSAYYLSLCRM